MRIVVNELAKYFFQYPWTVSPRLEQLTNSLSRDRRNINNCNNNLHETSHLKLLFQVKFKPSKLDKIIFTTSSVHFYGKIIHPNYNSMKFWEILGTYSQKYGYAYRGACD